MMTDITKLLGKIPLSLSDDVDELRDAFVTAKSAANEATRQFEEIKKALHEECGHEIILEAKSSVYGGTRSCYICGRVEHQPIDDPGNEYDFATYGSYKVLTGSEHGYMPSEGREVYRVESNEIGTIHP